MPVFTALDDRFLALVRAHLQQLQVRAQPTEGLRRAAVALALIEEGTGAGLPGLDPADAWSRAPAVLLTRRSAALSAHAGQWALPGGRLDAGETPEQAALRELHEEVGLELGSEAVLGRLDDYSTRSGYVITPVLMWAPHAGRLQASADEVASIHRIPVRELLREDAPLLNHVKGERGASGPVLRMPIGQSWIAAPTAAFLYQFRECCLLGRPTRVAHFDQPHFAWR